MRLDKGLQRLAVGDTVIVGEGIVLRQVIYVGLPKQSPTFVS